VIACYRRRRAAPRVRAAVAMVALAGLGACAADGAEERMVVVPFEQAQFVPIDPSRPDGPQIAVLWGDRATGPFAMYLRMPEGSSPLHYHTADYHLVVIQGEMKHWSAGEREEDAAVLGPGSYWFQPGGQAHGDSCLSDVCVMFVTFAGPHDGMLTDEGS